jgi:hypothetical protein
VQSEQSSDKVAFYEGVALLEECRHGMDRSKEPGSEHGIAVAEALANCRLFLLDEERWQAFLNALDQPAKDRPGLKRLLGSQDCLTKAR